MSNYAMEELLPIVAWLTTRYTRNESTSVTYERAEQLMGAVLYCIEEYEGTVIVGDIAAVEETSGGVQNQIRKTEQVSAKEAYETGYRMVLQKIEKVRASYNEKILHFNAYGNENYRDTVEKGIPGFFKCYDPKFAPQENIITMDYPTIIPVAELQGIDAIERYLEYIDLEQKFLGALPAGYVEEVLTAYQPDYRRQFYNICGIVLREVFGQKQLRVWLQEIQPARCSSKQLWTKLEKKMEQLLASLIREQYQDNQELFHYLSSALWDFSVELCEC